MPGLLQLKSLYSYACLAFVYAGYQIQWAIKVASRHPNDVSEKISMVEDDSPPEGTTLLSQFPTHERDQLSFFSAEGRSVQRLYHLGKIKSI